MPSLAIPAVSPSPAAMYLGRGALITMLMTVELASASLSRNSGRSKLTRHLLTVSALLLALLAAPAFTFAAPIALTQNGQPAAIIVTPDEPGDEITRAAEELQQHIKQISGAELPIFKAGSNEVGFSSGTRIVLSGAANNEAALAAIRKVSEDPAAFSITQTGQSIHVAGLSDEAVLFGAYDLLETLGVRWFHPGELGTVIPQTKNVSLDIADKIEAPSFAGRWQTNDQKDWQKRLRMGGPYFPASHGFPGFAGNSKQRQALLEQRPETFSYDRDKGVHTIGQICVSHPQSLEIVSEAVRNFFRKRPDAQVYGMGPNDGGGHCECDDCLALDTGDWDPMNNEVSHTDRYIWFLNRVIEKIEGEFPDKRLAMYLYHSYIRPPLREMPHPNVEGALAPIALCRVHGAGNPVCPEAKYYKSLIEAWGKLMPRLYDRGYWFNLADPGFPFIMIHRVRDQIPMAHDMGVYAWRVETLNHWGSETPSLYIAAKLMWNHEADVDALLEDFGDKYYGPAAKPMLAYINLLDGALRDGDFHTGSSFNLPDFYTPQLRDEARSRLDEAARLAGDSVFGRRVELTRTSFDYLEAFVEMLETRSRHDYAASQAALNRVDELQTKLIKNWDVSMIHARTAPSYLARFFRKTTEQGAARTSDGNRMVAGFDDTWQFLLDTEKLGESIGYHHADVRGGNWQPMKTSTRSWSDQGLRYYKGETWYRQAVNVPAEFKGKRIFLWVGGIDEHAKVWVNGQLIGISPAAAFVPFELDATEAIKAGENNVVAIRLANNRLDELGTGGITGPVMFYAPAAGDKAELENIRKPHPTFPAY